MDTNNKKIGPIVAALVVVLVIIIASLYFFGQKLNTTTPKNTQVAPTQEIETNATTSDNSAAAINADLDLQLKDIDYSF